MSDHPLVLRDWQVRAVLAGLKTEHRTPLREQPAWAGEFVAGDRLWVRETWQSLAGLYGHTAAPGDAPILYRADNPKGRWENFSVERWRPSIHMPRWASRITLEVVAVRAERLQEITEDGARAEGVDPSRYADENNRHLTHPYRDGFATIWDEIHRRKRAPWSANPWVWVVRFKRVDA